MSGIEHIIYLFNFPHKATLPPLFDKPINWMSREVFFIALSQKSKAEIGRIEH